VVKLQSRGGAAGSGEGGPSVAADIAQARSAIAGVLATDTELIRHRLAESPAMEAPVNNAMLDLAARSAIVPIYQFLGGPSRFKTRVVSHLEGESEDVLANSLRHALQRGFRAFSFPIPSREAMWRMQAYVDAIRAKVDRLRAPRSPRRLESAWRRTRSAESRACTWMPLSRTFCARRSEARSNRRRSTMSGGYHGFSRNAHVRWLLSVSSEAGPGFEIRQAVLKKYPFQWTRPFPPAFHADGSLAAQ
jgi:hypothetical protein